MKSEPTLYEIFGPNMTPETLESLQEAARKSMEDMVRKMYPSKEDCLRYKCLCPECKDIRKD